MDIAVTVITVAVVLFFAAVILSNVPWGRILGRRKQEEKVELAPGLRIRDPGTGAFLTPGSGMGKNPDPGWTSQIILPGNLKQFLWPKIPKFFDADMDPGSGIFLTLDPGSGMEKFGSGIKHPGSVILVGPKLWVTFPLLKCCAQNIELLLTFCHEIKHLFSQDIKILTNWIL